jgi:hypothetical protein
MLARAIDSYLDIRRAAGLDSRELDHRAADLGAAHRDDRRAEARPRASSYVVGAEIVIDGGMTL